MDSAIWAAPGRLPRLSQVVKHRQRDGLHAQIFAGANIVERLQEVERNAER
ncbi:MAG: hypothetical protein WAM50_03420 [Pseudolabrys sp.]